MKICRLFVKRRNAFFRAQKSALSGSRRETCNGARRLESVGLKVKEMAKENKSVGAGKKF
jgi:hypothetical protein